MADPWPSSGDTDYCQNIIDLAFEVDILVLECSFPTGKKSRPPDPFLGGKNCLGITVQKAIAHPFLSNL